LKTHTAWLVAIPVKMAIQGALSASLRRNLMMLRFAV